MQAGLHPPSQHLDQKPPRLGIVSFASTKPDRALVLQPGFIAGSPFPMALPGALLVSAAPARPGACSLGIRRPGPNQMPEQASYFGHGEGQEIGFEIERVFFPRPQYDGSRRDRHAPASPA